MRVDRDDHIWAIDKGSDMVVRFNPAGQVVMVFVVAESRRTRETKPWEEVDPPLPPVDGLFRQPTDVAWDSNGNTYLSDGYVNSRVAKYDRNGDWVMSWGEPGTGPGQFHLPHAIAIDREDRVYVGDRMYRRIRCSTPVDASYGCSRSTYRQIAHASRERQYTDRRPIGRSDRRTELDLHTAGADPGHVRR